MVLIAQRRKEAAMEASSEWGGEIEMKGHRVNTESQGSHGVVVPVNADLALVETANF